MKKGLIAIIGILTIVLTIAFGYGITFGFACIIMWALAKLGIIGMWTYGQAALWALIAYIGHIFFAKSNKGKGKDKE